MHTVQNLICPKIQFFVEFLKSLNFGVKIKIV